MITYRTPRQRLGSYLANIKNDVPIYTVERGYSPYYNEEQKEYWYKEADKLLKLLGESGLD